MLEAYERIQTYCLNEKIPENVRDHAYCCLVVAYKQALDAAPNNTPNTKTRIKEALLQEESMKGFVLQGQAKADQALEILIRNATSRSKIGEFVLNVMASIMAAIVLTVVGIVVYNIGHSEIQKWMAPNGNAPPEVDQSKNAK